MTKLIIKIHLIGMTKLIVVGTLKVDAEKRLCMRVHKVSKIVVSPCKFNAACNSSVKLRGAAILSPQAKTTASRQYIMQRGTFIAVRVNWPPSPHVNRARVSTMSTPLRISKSHPPTLGVSGKSSHTDTGWTLQGHCRQSLLSIPAPPSSYPSEDRAAR